MLNDLDHFAFLVELKNLNLRMRLCFDKICTNINTIYCLIWTQILICVSICAKLCTYMHEHACVCVLKCVYMYTCTFFINRILRKCSSPIGHVEICQLLFYPNQIIWVSFDFASNIQIYKHQNASLEEVRTTVVHTHTCASKVLLLQFNNNQDNNWVKFWVACFYN